MNKELRAKTDEELLKMFVQLKGQLLQLRFLQANGELDKPHKINQIKTLIARVLTILTQRKINYNNVIHSTVFQQQENNVQQKVLSSKKMTKIEKTKKSDSERKYKLNNEEKKSEIKKQIKAKKKNLQKEKVKK